MDASEKNRLRKEYRPPPPINFLMVGESPPAGKNFFYLCKGPLYEHTRRVFERAFEEEDVTSGKTFLRWFEAKGCYIEDLCEQSTNCFKWGSPQRKNAWTEGKPRLGAEIASLRPRAMFVFVEGISTHVISALKSSVNYGLDGSLIYVIPVYHGPMPESKGDPSGTEFEKALERCIIELKRRRIL
jgi:hypothetical protein